MGLVILYVCVCVHMSHEVSASRTVFTCACVVIPAGCTVAMDTVAIDTVAVGSPVVGTVAVGSPVVGTVAVGSPVVGTVAMGSPVVGTVAMGSPSPADRPPLCTLAGMC